MNKYNLTLNDIKNKFLLIIMNKDFVFIIIRHVNNYLTSMYWKESYECIREFYPDTMIYIIDDNSTYDSEDNHKRTNLKIINSEYPQRGELLAYYYFHKLKLAKKAIIIHDSTFINDKINLNNIETYKFLWHFRHDWDDDNMIINILKKYKQSEKLIEFYNKKNLWKGWFGMQGIITWDFIDKINKEFNFFEISLRYITNRSERMCLERILACLCVFQDGENDSIHGDMEVWYLQITKKKMEFPILFKDYLFDKPKHKKYPIMKIWSGR